jgi:hypothetical protein
VSVWEKGPVADPLGPFSFWAQQRAVSAENRERDTISIVGFVAKH